MRGDDRRPGGSRRVDVHFHDRGLQSGSHEEPRAGDGMRTRAATLWRLVKAARRTAKARTKAPICAGPLSFHRRAAFEDNSIFTAHSSAAR